MSASPKNVLLALLTVALLALAPLAWWQRQRIAGLEQAAARDAAALAAAQKKASDTEQQLASAEKRRAELEAERTETRTRAAERTRPAAGTQVARSVPNVLENPAMQRMLATGMRAALDQRYGTLFRQLKLSPAELEKLKDLLTERQMSTLDAMNAARAQGVAAGELPALMSKVQADIDQGIRQLLGDERYPRYENFNQHSASYAALDQVERRLSYTNAPLDATQSEALLRILIETAPPAPAEGGIPARNMIVQSFAGAAAPILGAMSGPAITNETIARASTVLSPAQTEVLRQLQAEQQSQTSAMQAMRGDAAARGGAVEVFEAPAGQTIIRRVQPAAPPPAPAPAPQR